MNDIFDKRLARPMLIANQSEPFNSPEYLFELKMMESDVLHILIEKVLI